MQFIGVSLNNTGARGKSYKYNDKGGKITGSGVHYCTMETLKAAFAGAALYTPKSAVRGHFEHGSYGEYGGSGAF